jgi:hypothetical protein
VQDHLVPEGRTAGQRLSTRGTFLAIDEGDVPCDSITARVISFERVAGECGRTMTSTACSERIGAVLENPRSGSRRSVLVQARAPTAR